MADDPVGLNTAEQNFESALVALSAPSWKSDESSDTAAAKRKRRVLRAIALLLEALGF